MKSDDDFVTVLKMPLVKDDDEWIESQRKNIEDKK